MPMSPGCIISSPAITTPAPAASSMPMMLTFWVPTEILPALTFLHTAGIIQQFAKMTAVIYGMLSLVQHWEV